MNRENSDQRRLASESVLELELWHSHAPEEAVNKKIVQAFVHVLPQRSPELRDAITVSLHRMLLLMAPTEANAAHNYQAKLLQDIDPGELRAAVVALHGEQGSQVTGTMAGPLISLFSGRLH